MWLLKSRVRRGTVRRSRGALGNRTEHGTCHNAGPCRWHRLVGGIVRVLVMVVCVVSPVRHRKTEQGAELLLRGAHRLQDFAADPHRGNQKSKLSEKTAELVPIALYPICDVIHGSTLA